MIKRLCYQCKEQIDTNKDIHYDRDEGLQCRACHIRKVFGSLQAFGKEVGLGTLYEYSKDYIQTWRGF